MTTPPPPPPITAWSADCAGTLIHLAILDTGRQLIVWGSPRGALGALALATPWSPSSSTAASSTPPPAATLLPGDADAPSRALAVRLARATGRPVCAAWSVPPASGADEAVAMAAERELVARLAELGHFKK